MNAALSVLAAPAANRAGVMRPQDTRRK